MKTNMPAVAASRLWQGTGIPCASGRQIIPSMLLIAPGSKKALSSSPAAPK